jgi:hypothetical protein
MYRYLNADDFGRLSSSFTICTFWLIRGLYVTGETVEAKEFLTELWVTPTIWDYSAKIWTLKPKGNWGIFRRHIRIWP